MIKLKNMLNESSRDPASIKKEYKELKKQSISYLRKEWSRINKVGNPNSLDKEGLVSDIIRAYHGNKYVDKAFEGKISEALKKDGHLYNAEEVGQTSGTDRGGIAMDKAFAGKDGILGNNGTYISWSDVKRLMRKYSR